MYAVHVCCDGLIDIWRSIVSVENIALNIFIGTSFDSESILFHIHDRHSPSKYSHLQLCMHEDGRDKNMCDRF